MVLPISGFLPVPLPMMIPFMGAQSLVIGKMFGEGFQYGKRKISAMPNEEFNALTFADMMSNARDEMQASIPTMQKAMQDMKPMVETVVHEFTNYLSLVIDRAPSEVSNIINQLAHAAFPHGPETPEEFNLLKELDILPPAFATDMPSAGTSIALSGPSTIAGLTVTQAQQAARDKQLAYDIEQRRLRDIRADALAKGLISPVTGAIAPVRTQQAAGQSQKLERLRLIKLIAAQAVTVKSGATYAIRSNAAKFMREYQQKLNNLLDRYRF